MRYLGHLINDKFWWQQRDCDWRRIFNTLQFWRAKYHPIEDEV